MVQRYDCQGAVVTHAEGPFVLYKDYVALELKVLAALSHLERADQGGTYGLMSGYIRMAIRELGGDK